MFFRAACLFCKNVHVSRYPIYLSLFTRPFYASYSASFTFISGDARVQWLLPVPRDHYQPVASSLLVTILPSIFNILSLRCLPCRILHTTGASYTIVDFQAVLTYPLRYSASQPSCSSFFTYGMMARHNVLCNIFCNNIFITRPRSKAITHIA